MLANLGSSVAEKKSGHTLNRNRSSLGYDTEDGMDDIGDDGSATDASGDSNL